MRSRFARRLRRSIGLESLEPRCLLAADVFISEFLASNSGGLLDEDGDDSDWIEVFNAGPDDVNLDGWHLTDDADELGKWDFPNQTLPAGNFLLVYASGKDRAIAGQPLHTDFRLGAGGEYLALTRNEPGGGPISIVSQFDPEFPEQLTNISYGVTQNVGEQQLVSAGDPARVLIPLGGPPDPLWNTSGFDDASWQSATSAIGYQQTVAGFTVQDARSSSSLLNLSEADAVLSGVGQVSQTIAITPVVNFLDSEGGGGVGNFADDLAFPDDSPDDDNDFAIRATGTVLIPTGGVWTFGTNSDDGVRLLVDGETVIEDDALHAPLDQFGEIELDAGPHRLELTFFERGGGAEVELYAASGSQVSFDSSFRLVGDVANGGLAVETSVTGGETGFNALIETDVAEAMFQEATSAYLRIPFDVPDLAALDSLTLRMNYDDGFVAYLNGVEVARRNAPDDLGFESVATVNRPEAESLFVEDINISSHLGLLTEGPGNVLAIQGLNDSVDGNEFLIAAGLADVQVAQGQRVYFLTPSPREFNPSTGVQDFLINDVTLDQPHGFYEQPFELTITSATQGTSIRYTLDGSAPSETNGFDYTGPVTIDRTTTVRARSFKADTEPSYVATGTYILLQDVLEQSPTGRAPEGFPSSRTINGQQLDYGMDPDIVNSSEWGPQMIDALTQVPTMSLVMDIDDLLGTRNGIYTHAESHGRAWERPASLELINPDGSEGFQVEAGLRIRGGFSRTGSNPKHAFRLFFRDEYGDSKLEFPLFGDEGVSEFDKIDLRTTQNYSWAFQGDGRNNFLRDVFSRDAQGEMGQPYTRGRYYHLYINGQYWGLYQTEERPEANYASSYFGGNDSDYDVVKSSGGSGGHQNEATDGNLDAYRRLADYFYQGNGLGDANMEDYWRAQGMNPDGTRNPDYERLLDVDSLIDYMILTYYTSDADGPGSRFTRPRVNNYFAIYNRENPDGFKFFEHDSEHSLDTGNAAGANYNLVSPLSNGGSQFRYFNPHWMHEQLAQANTEYRTRFADEVYRQFHHDGVLTDANAQRLLDSRAAEINLAMIAESARWGDSRRNTPFTQANWESAVQTTRNWVVGRTETVLTQLRAEDWYPEDQPPQFTAGGELQHGGEVSSNDGLGFVSFGSISYDTILRRGSEWRYLDDGSDQGTAWREPGFDDSGWEAGAAQLGYGDGDERTVVSFGPNSGNKFRTTYFRKPFVVDGLAQYEAAQIRLLRDDGAVVYLNGQEIARSNMPGGTINYQTESSGTAGGAEESAFFEYNFDLSLLRNGVNELAVEVHQTSGTSSDISFDFELLLGGFNIAEGAIYYTLDGSDPRLSGGELNPEAQRYDDRPFFLDASATLSTRMLKNGQWTAINVAGFDVTSETAPGDLNRDGQVNAADIDILARAVREGNQDAALDLDGSALVDAADLTYLVESILNTRPGDADLDGDVEFNDFTALAADFGSAPAGWAQGDFDGDAEVAFGDFVVLASNFGFNNRVLAAPPLQERLTAAPALLVSPVPAAHDHLFADSDSELGDPHCDATDAYDIAATLDKLNHQFDSPGERAKS